MSMTRPTTEQITHQGRLLSGVLAGIVNVKEFGAVGDGVADDTAAIQNAIDASSAVHFPAGTYKVTSRILGKSNLMLRGDGPGSSRIVYTYEQQSADALLTEGWAGALGNQNAAVLKKSLFVFLDGDENIVVRDLFLEYTGTFDTGSSYSGKIAAINLGYCNNVLVENVHGTGWNHSVVYLRPHTTAVGASLANVSRYLTFRDCNMYENRVSGIWYTHCQHVLIENGVFRRNGLATDPGTGYGTATSGYATAEWPRDVIVSNCLYDSNRRTGCDFHRGNDIVVTRCTFTAPPGVSEPFMQHTHMYGIDMIGGSLRITNNTFGTLRDRDVDVYARTAAIDIRHGTELLRPVDIIISGNVFMDIDVPSGGTKEGQVITFSDNAAKDLSVTITDNVFEAVQCHYLIFGTIPAIAGSTVRRSLVLSGNTFNATTIHVDEVFFGNLRTATISNNVMNVTNAPNRQGYRPLPITTASESLNGKVRVMGNDTQLGNYVNGLSHFDYIHEAYGNTYNNAPEPNRRISLVSGTYKQLFEWMTGSTNPVDFFSGTGSTVHYSGIGSGASPGAYCVDRTQRSLTAVATTGATSLAINASIGGTNGDPIVIALANGDVHKTTIASGAGTSSVTITDAMPSDSFAASFNVVRVGWKALAAIAS